MPREFIQTGNPGTPSSVSIGWQRDGGVQLATVRPAVYDGEPPAGSPVDDGIFVDLGRYEINQLIRTLRRARDQAFGADE